MVPTRNSSSTGIANGPSSTNAWAACSVASPPANSSRRSFTRSARIATCVFSRPTDVVRCPSLACR